MRKLFFCLSVAWGLWVAPAHAATYSISVLFSSGTAQPATQKSFLAATTSQFNVDLLRTTWGSDTYTLTIKGKNPSYLPPVASTNTVDANALLAALVSISSATYPYAWVDGLEYERDKNLMDIQNFNVNCSSQTFYVASTDTWDQDTCTRVLEKTYRFIYEQSFSTPTLIPGF